MHQMIYYHSIIHYWIYLNGNCIDNVIGLIFAIDDHQGRTFRQPNCRTNFSLHTSPSIKLSIVTSRDDSMFISVFLLVLHWSSWYVAYLWPVTNDVTITVLLTSGCRVHIVDVKGTFLHDDIEDKEEICTNIPEGFERWWDPKVWV